MNFTVSIITGILGTKPFDNFNPGKGLDIIQVVRDELNDQSIDSEIIDINKSCSYESSIECELCSTDTFSPDQLNSRMGVESNIINLIPQFAAKNYINVYIPPGFLGRYQEMKIVKHFKTGANCNGFLEHLWYIIVQSKLKRKLRSIKVYYEFNEKEFLADWIESGCPTYYNCDKDTIDALDTEIRKKLYQKSEDDKEADRQLELKREAVVRDTNRKRLKEYAEDLAVMQSRLVSIVNEIYKK